MNYLVKSILSVFLIVSGAINFLTMYELLGRKAPRFSSEDLRRIHRYSGYVFIALFVLLSYLCLVGIIKNPSDFTPRGIVHAVIALTVFILLSIKLMTIRFYRGFMGEVPTLGKNVFVLSLILFFISGGYYFLLMYPQKPTETLLVQNKCSRCHTLERIYSISKSETEWKNTVSRMANRVPGWILPNEQKQIVDYLVKTTEE